ncbi:hypothetical protein BU15DRAFT_73648 [Melanogaster broomeanus]|nr:hypothetical protein BU15DRAFT_73648 [Melanogaster broomeanus]
MSVSLAGLTNTLEDPSYLLSPIETITDSFHEHSSTSVHDLLDAYSTFSSRIRSHNQMLRDCARPLPSLDCLRVNKDDFLQALRRDIGFAHIDILSIFSRSRPSLDEAMFGGSIHASIKVDARQRARDSSSLCVHALCAIATIFRFPAFHSLFSAHDLSGLLGDVLGIALADQLPVLNSAKIYSLSLWVLGCHRLPLAVLSARHDEIILCLRRSLKGARQPASVAVDGMKAISHTLAQFPSEFLTGLSPLLPYVVQNLLVEPSDRRLHASIALGRFANALIHQAESSLTGRQTISKHIMSFIERHCDDAQTSPGDRNLSFVVRTAFSAETQKRLGEGPTWILAVLASLIILSGPSLYSNSIALQFILQSLAMSLTHKRSVVRALHSHVWKCFVWTFDQMLSSAESIDLASILSALYVIRQELGGGIGTALTTVLLRSPDRTSTSQSGEGKDRLSQALSVIQAMVRTDCKHTRQEGFLLLRALTTGICDPKNERRALECVDDVLALALFDGTIVGADWERLPSIIRSMPLCLPSVHRLEEAEVVLHYEILLDIWKHCALKASKEPLDSLQDMEVFLASAFSRIPTPAIAPFAFEKFWRATYHGRSQFDDILPPRIKSCLVCFVAAYGGDLADGLSLPTESQSQNNSNGFASQSHTGYKLSGGSGFWDVPWSLSKADEFELKVFDPETIPQARERTFPGPEDTTFLLADEDDEVFQSTVLRQLQDYSSRLDTSSLDELDRSISDPHVLLPSICSPPRGLPTSRSPERSSVTSQVQERKRKQTYGVDVPRKRSRMSSDTLRSLRKLDSEPVTRDITPISIARTNSVPVKSRKMTFDGIEVPTLREVLRKEKALKTEVRKNTPSSEPGPSGHKDENALSPLPSSMGSDEEDEIEDWENTRIDGTLSEIEIDQSLADVYPSSPPRSQSSGAHEPEYEPSGSNIRQTRSQSEGSPSVPTRHPLRRSKTTSARLDALRDVYASMADGASQIPISELLQATRLVHKIGAALTEQMDKKIGDPG